MRKNCSFWFSLLMFLYLFCTSFWKPFLQRATRHCHLSQSLFKNTFCTFLASLLFSGFRFFTTISFFFYLFCLTTTLNTDKWQYTLRTLGHRFLVMFVTLVLFLFHTRFSSLFIISTSGTKTAAFKWTATNRKATLLRSSFLSGDFLFPFPQTSHLISIISSAFVFLLFLLLWDIELYTLSVDDTHIFMASLRHTPSLISHLHLLDTLLDTLLHTKTLYPFLLSLFIYYYYYFFSLIPIFTHTLFWSTLSNHTLYNRHTQRQNYCLTTWFSNSFFLFANCIFFNKIRGDYTHPKPNIMYYLTYYRYTEQSLY